MLNKYTMITVYYSFEAGDGLIFFGLFLIFLGFLGKKAASPEDSRLIISTYSNNILIYMIKVTYSELYAIPLRNISFLEFLWKFPHGFYK